MNEIRQNNFVNLHVHTEYSLLDGMSKIKDLVGRVAELGQPACAITDHGSMAGVVEFYDECVKKGIKPIVGCEVYVAPGSRFEKGESKKSKDREAEKAAGDHYYHLILLAKNETGYKNLCRLVTRSNVEGFYYKPRVDRELLEAHHEGLICCSACIGGEVPKLIIANELEKAEETILWYKNLFGEDYYLEIQHHGIPEEDVVAQQLFIFSRKLGVKLVATNDSHYVRKEDAEAHEWLLCLQTGKTINDPTRLRYVGDYSIKSEEEMLETFPWAKEAVWNTMEIADKVDFKFEYGHYRMPRVDVPAEFGGDYQAYLASLAWQGFENRYPVGHPEREQAAKDVEYELGVIKQMGFAEYFLDTRKTIAWARSQGILVGPGRGSGAGSRLNYCLGITDIDPVRYGLLFEREKERAL